MKMITFFFMVLTLIMVCAPMQAFADDAEPAEETVVTEEITEDIDVEMTETEPVAVEAPEPVETPVRPEPTALEKAVSYEYVGRGVFNADFSDLQIPESQSEEFLQALRYAGLIEDGIVCTVENGVITGIDWAPDEPIEESKTEEPAAVEMTPVVEETPAVAESTQIVEEVPVDAAVAETSVVEIKESANPTVGTTEETAVEASAVETVKAEPAETSETMPQTESRKFSIGQFLGELLVLIVGAAKVLKAAVI